MNQKLCKTIEFNIDQMNLYSNDDFIQNDLTAINKILYTCIDYNLYSDELDKFLDKLLAKDYSDNSIFLGYDIAE